MSDRNRIIPIDALPENVKECAARVDKALAGEGMGTAMNVLLNLLVYAAIDTGNDDRLIERIKTALDVARAHRRRSGSVQ